MPIADQGARVRPADVERWLDDLGLRPDARSDREGVTSWDLRLDGRRRFDVPITLILDPSLALIVWVHFAPPIGDAFRKSYRRLLRWNDEFPFAKFSVGEDERPLLAVETPIDVALAAGADGLGTALARIVGIADRLLDESKDWIWLGGRTPDQGDRTSRNEAFLRRFEPVLPELLGPAAPEEPAGEFPEGSRENPLGSCPLKQFLPLLDQGLERRDRKVLLSREAFEFRGRGAGEERLLFPVLEAQAARPFAPTSRMRMEHWLLRHLVASLRDALHGDDRARGLRVLASLRSVFALHQAKEDWIIHPLLASLVTPATESAVIRWLVD